MNENKQGGLTRERKQEIICNLFAEGRCTDDDLLIADSIEREALSASAADWKQYHSALSQCAELLDNMQDGDLITDVPKFLAAKLATRSPVDLEGLARFTGEAISDIEVFEKEEFILAGDVQSLLATTKQAGEVAGWVYECRQPHTDPAIWSEFFSRNKPVAGDWVRNIAPLYTAPPAPPVPAEPVAYLRYWAAQSWSGNGNHDIEHGEGLEVCEKGQVGSDGSPAFPVFASPVPVNDVQGEREAADNSWLITDPPAVVKRLREATQELLDAACEYVPSSERGTRIEKALTEADNALADCVGDWPAAPSPVSVSERVPEAWRESLTQIAGWLDSSAQIVQNGPDDYGPASQFDYELGQAAAEIRSLLGNPVPPDAPAKTIDKPVLGARAWFHRGMVNFDAEDALSLLDDGKGTPIDLYIGAPPAAPTSQVPADLRKLCSEMVALHKERGTVLTVHMDALASLIATPSTNGERQHDGELTADDVEWVVNDLAELGVKIGSQFFFLYKGDSLQYESGKHDDGTPMRWRPVGKREFGECCHPVKFWKDNTPLPHRYTDELVYTPGLSFGQPGDCDWRDLPPASNGNSEGEKA